MKYDSTCPDCKSKNNIKKYLSDYTKTLYKCEKCNRAWDEGTKYCKVCLDVVQYCDCYKDLI